MILLVGILFLFGLGILLGPDRLRPEDQGPPPWECPDTFPEEWALTGNCPIREHTGDGVYVGRCDFATHADVCPRHGRLSDYPNLDDRDLDPGRRRWSCAE